MGRIFAVIPAAGRSGRMGRPKQLLCVNGRPMLLAVTEPINRCSLIRGVVVVTNSLVASSLDLAAAGVSVVLNDKPDAEMIDSVRVGIGCLQRDAGLGVSDAVLICPGDQPGLATTDIDRCCAASKANREAVVIAAHDGKPGHPMIFPASMVPLVMSDACCNGLRSLREVHRDRVVTIECQSPAVLRNVNTPDDYDRLTHG